MGRHGVSIGDTCGRRVQTQGCAWIRCNGTIDTAASRNGQTVMVGCTGCDWIGRAPTPAVDENSLFEVDA